MPGFFSPFTLKHDPIRRIFIGAEQEAREIGKPFFESVVGNVCTVFVPDYANSIR